MRLTAKQIEEVKAVARYECERSNRDEPRRIYSERILKLIEEHNMYSRMYNLVRSDFKSE